MAIHPDYPRTRLFVEQPLGVGTSLRMEEKQHHYLQHVLRFKEGDQVALFNGQDGEWLGTITTATKKNLEVGMERQLRPQPQASDLWLAFAPLKSNATDNLAQKATELGASKLIPVFTQHTSATRINRERLRDNAIEAAEQCERLDIPVVAEEVNFAQLLSSWPAGRMLLYGDESGKAPPIAEVLPILPDGAVCILVGPEGGFAPAELDTLRTLPYARGLSLGPRVLRADTAAIAALACFQALKGDWDAKPAFRNHG